ncbi:MULTISPECIES: S-layer homology domain-containing protein [unclassified Lysinibacillus]|uniref:S-layer homology domain-containing protein n=1 Tax=unclassified Lysinibacillus TaxID=2636778 RepID=UPI003811614C
MANQPKKYKKFVATAATATLVASAIVPVASAASFTDVPNSNSHKDAISSLVDAGIIKGYPDGTFKPDQYVSRGQVVKLLGRWLETEGNEIPADWNTKQRFNDLPVTTADKELVQYAALVKDAGAFNGANGNLNYSQNMARQQMAIVLVRAIKEIQDVDLVKEYKDAKFTSEISDLGGLNTEQREAITALEYAELTKAATLPGKAFKPNDTITRAQFASFLDRTMKLEVPSHAKAAVKAINNTTVEVTFDQEVDNVQALNFEIKDLEVKNAAVKLTNKKVVVLTTAPQTADKEYTVSLGGEEIGKFKGVNAVIPTKVDLVEKSVQGKLGQQVTLKAQVTVAEGASKAGIPVTFFIPGDANGVKAPVTIEAVTNDEGIATYSYTRYAATNDTVTVYANGDRSKFSTGYVFWAVDTTIAITEVTTGATVNNGANKVYKVTYKDPATGKPVSGKTLNVSVKENIDVTVDKLQDVTINGVRVAQTNNSNTTAAQITTDSKGEATFTMTGSNAEVTPVVFAGETVSGKTSQKYNADALQTTAPKVKFGALQADYVLEVTRDGGEEAATGYDNGRKYKVIVKDKNGKLAANETVNVAFNEDIDGVISTTTDAKFVKVEDGKQVGYEDKYDKNAKQIVVKTDSKGEATFVIGNDKVNSYATPIVWIDINYQSGKVGTLDKGEPSAIAPISYFQAPTIDGSKLVAKDSKNEENSKFVGNDPAKFEVVLVNQSGKTMKNSGYTTQDVSYSIENTGANDLTVTYTYNKEVKTAEIPPNRITSVIADNGTIEVKAKDNKSTSVKVLATGVAKKIVNNVVEKEFAFSAKEATATFTSTSEVTNLFTGDIKSFNTDKKTVVFTDNKGDKEAVKYAGETGKTYVYKNVNGAPLSEEQLVKTLKDATSSVKATYEVKDNTVTIYLLAINNGGDKPADTIAVGEEDTSVSSIKVKNVAATGAGNTYNVVFPVGTDLTTIKAEDVVVTTTNSGAKVAAATTANNGATWTVEVTAKDGKTKATYTINASVSATVLNSAKITTEAKQGKPAVGIPGTKGSVEVSGVTFTATDAADGNGNGIAVKLEAGTPAAGKAEAKYDATNKELTVTFAANTTQGEVAAAVNALTGAEKVVTATAAVAGTDVAVANGTTAGGYEAEITAVDGVLTLTFSDAVALAANDAVILTVDGTQVNGTVATVSADKKVITVSHAYNASVVVDKALTAINFNGAALKDAGGNTVKTSTVLTK